MKITKSKLKQLIKEELEALNERKVALGKLAGNMVPDAARDLRAIDDGARVLISDLQERVVELEMKILRLEDRGPQNY